MLKGKTAIVTGGSRGIDDGNVCTHGCQFAYNCCTDAGNLAAAEAVCEQCTEEFGVAAKMYPCNVASFEETKATVASIKADFGAVHILVNNAGVTKDSLLAMMGEDAWDTVMDTNLKGAFNMTRHCTGLFLRAKEGCIINISSVSGLMGNAGQCNYSASKAGLVGLTKSVAKELAPKGIRCNAIAPGFIRTAMTQTQENNPLLSMIPLGRMGEAEEIAEAAAYLATANYVTGEVLRIDGGIAM